MENKNDKSKNVISNKKIKQGIYTSYNALAGRAEIKSVSQSMHEFIKKGFSEINR